MAEWCDFNDMPADTCAHCKGIPDIGAEPLRFTRLSNAVEAAYPGKCVHCEERYEAGAQIQRVREVAGDEGWALYGHV